MKEMAAVSTFPMSKILTPDSDHISRENSVVVTATSLLVMGGHPASRKTIRPELYLTISTKIYWQNFWMASHWAQVQTPVHAAWSCQVMWGWSRLFVVSILLDLNLISSCLNSFQLTLTFEMAVQMNVWQSRIILVTRAEQSTFRLTLHSDMLLLCIREASRTITQCPGLRRHHLKLRQPTENALRQQVFWVQLCRKLTKVSYHYSDFNLKIMHAESFFQASSTKLLLSGKTPGQYDTSLYIARVKQDIVRSMKKKKNGAGSGVIGA